jgi:hypothetical protein
VLGTKITNPILEKIGGNQMISKTCNINEFIEAVKGKPFSEIIMLANQEATQADRMFFRHRQRDKSKSLFGKEYSEELKYLITYLKYSVKPKISDSHAFKIFFTGGVQTDH